MNPLVILQRPGRFLVSFAAATAVSLAVWQWVSAYYLAALVWVANLALASAGTAVVMRVPAPGDEMIYPVMAGALALFAVTPGRSPAWKVRWLAGLLTGLFLLHAGMLFLDARSAVVARNAALLTPPVAGLADLARTQLTLALVTLTWVLAGRRDRTAAGDCDPGLRSRPA